MGALFYSHIVNELLHYYISMTVYHKKLDAGGEICCYLQFKSINEMQEGKEKVKEETAIMKVVCGVAARCVLGDQKRLI